MKTRTKSFSLGLLLLMAVNNSFAGTWTNFSNITQTTDALVKNNTLWITAKGGIIKTDQTTGQKTFIHKGEAGLLSTSVEKVITNALTGDTWIGTYDNGLARWNGTTFVSYPFPENMLLQNMQFDSYGKIWMESDLGLYRFDPTAGVYTKINDAPTNTWTYNAWGYDFLTQNKAAVFNGTSSLIIDVLSGVVLDSFQNPIDTTTLLPGEFGLNIIFQGCAPNAVSLFAIDSETCLLQNSNLIVLHQKNGILRKATMGLQSGENVVNIIRNELGEIILLSELNNLYKWNGNGWRLLMAVPLQSMVSRLLSAHNGTYYFNTISGTNLYSLSSVANAVIDARQYAFASNQIRAIAEIPTGGVVISSADKLLSYDSPSHQWVPYLTVPSKYDMVGNIKFLNGIMYYIDYGNMMYRYDGIKFDSIPKLVVGTSNDVYDYDVEPNGTIWIVNGDGVLKYDGTSTRKVMNNVPNRYYLSVEYDDLRRQLWIGTSKGIIQYDVDFGTSTLIDHSIIAQMAGAEAIQTIVADRHNNIWFGANNSRVVMYDGSQYTVLGLPNAQTNDFVVDIDFNQDTAYFNMSGGSGGVYKYINGNFQFLHPTTEPQLVSALNDDILIDKNGNLWLAHEDAGVSMLRNTTTSNIKGADKNVLSFYPNPTNNMINILGEFVGEATYTLGDLDGKIIMQGMVIENKINFDGIASGVYFLHVIDRDYAWTLKMLKQ